MKLARRLAAVIAAVIVVTVPLAAHSLRSVAPLGHQDSKPGRQAPILRVNHIAPQQCGVKQASFARICRAGAHTSCLKAVRRGVKGFSNLVCAARQTACHSCLDRLRACIGKIGHAKRIDFSCEECTGKFSRCIGKRYPQIKS